MRILLFFLILHLVLLQILSNQAAHYIEVDSQLSDR